VEFLSNFFQRLQTFCIGLALPKRKIAFLLFELYFCNFLCYCSFHAFIIALSVRFKKEHLFCYTLGVQKIEIIPFRPVDQDAAKALILEGLVEHWGFLDESLNPDLDDIATTYADGLFLVAWQDDQLIGTGAFKPHSATQVEIVRMSMDKTLRRQGIGRKILAELCQRAADAGYEEVILETTETWQDVIDFYLDYGFEITHHQDGDVYFKMKL
jgi:GNAT superfamily N-acetyltransferase